MTESRGRVPLSLAGRNSRNSGAADLGQQTRQALATLSPREEMILRCGFGIGVETSASVGEVSQKFSMTPAQVRQLQARAFSKLRQNTRAPWPRGSGSL
jgi:DNA-directed RNA polymerase sigma subunit (sigma70/sigma32)